MQRICLFVLSIVLLSCGKDDDGEIRTDILRLESVKVGTTPLSLTEQAANIAVDKGIVAVFSLKLARSSVENNLILKDADDQNIVLEFHYLNDDKTVSAIPVFPLENNKVYTVVLGPLKAVTGEEFPGAIYTFKTAAGSITLESITVNGIALRSSERIQNIPVQFSIEANFSESLDIQTPFADFIAVRDGNSVPLNFSLSDDQKKLNIYPLNELKHLSQYTLDISSDLISEEGFIFGGFENSFYTALDSTLKFPEITDEELLTKVQQQTFKYFWDFAHPVSGLARERNSSDLVTIGGSGFGVMTILVGVERGFITRQEGMDRLETIVNFLAAADRFHGAWPHWMDGNTGKVIPFSQKDDGGDLVETAFMIQGLLTVREYLNDADPQELGIKNTITQLWEQVEWDWYTQGQNVLYWHWSPNYGWEMNHQIKGWNEALIVYVLAASSPTHPVDAAIYHQGWAANGGMKNGSEYYGIELPLGNGRGGPLFFAHYSFLGLDPRNLEDQYAHYWTQNVNHTLINRAYSIANPKNYVGYGSGSWGLTASDNHEGYSAHSPDNDLGVIAPTAAISSLPYTPEYSMEAIRHFYYLLGDKLWGEYGFYDAFNFTEEWVADSYLAIDQGPIIIMIENHRTALLWELFMSNPEIGNGLNKLNFTSY